MAPRKTNSNSITIKLKNILNNKKSGFRIAMMNRFGLTDSNTIFMDGTHSPVNLPEMQSKEIDIWAKDTDNNFVLLLEVKANVDEDLQDSQKRNGEYEKTANKNNIPLFYIIPPAYSHEKQIPKIAEIIYWDEILDIAKECDNTGFAEEILSCVENLKNEENVLSKAEASLLFCPELLKNLLELKRKIGLLMDNYEKSENTLIINSEQENGDDYFGRYIYVKNGKRKVKFWIGYYPYWDNNFSYFLQVIDTDIIDETRGHEGKDYYKSYWDDLSGFDIYFPVFNKDAQLQKFLNCENEADQQKNFNKIINDVINAAVSFIK